MFHNSPITSAHTQALSFEKACEFSFVFFHLGDFVLTTYSKIIVRCKEREIRGLANISTYFRRVVKLWLHYSEWALSGEPLLWWCWDCKWNGKKNWRTNFVKVAGLVCVTLYLWSFTIPLCQYSSAKKLFPSSLTY